MPFAIVVVVVAVVLVVAAQKHSFSLLNLNYYYLNKTTNFILQMKIRKLYVPLTPDTLDSHPPSSSQDDPEGRFRN